MSNKKDVSFTTKERGTTDEFEILKVVVNENPAIKIRVMEKLRGRLREMNKDKAKEKVLRPDQEDPKK